MRTGRQAVTCRRAQKRSKGHAKLKGVALLVASLLMVTYAIPCFAASIWDEGLSSQGGGTIFAAPIKDADYVTEATSDDSSPAAASASSVRAASKVNASVTETTGPGIAADEDAVVSAKKRVQAVSAAKVERDAVIGVISAERVQQDRTLELMSASFAFALGLLCAILGTRSIASARKARASIASASYSNALKA